MRTERAGYQSQAAYEQHQHDDGVHQTGRLEVDMQVGNHAGKNKNRTRDRQQPSNDAAAVPE